MPKGMDHHIESHKQRTGLTYIESFLEYCEMNGHDPEEIVLDLNRPLIEKIKAEFKKKRVVKNENLKSTFNDEFF